MHADRCASRRLAKDRDVVGIAAELVDIALDPLHRQTLIEESCVISDAIVQTRHEAKRTKSIIERYNDHVAKSSQNSTIVDV